MIKGFLKFLGLEEILSPDRTMAEIDALLSWGVKKTAPKPELQMSIRGAPPTVEVPSVNSVMSDLRLCYVGYKRHLAWEAEEIFFRYWSLLGEAPESDVGRNVFRSYVVARVAFLDRHAKNKAESVRKAFSSLGYDVDSEGFEEELFSSIDKLAKEEARSKDSHVGWALYPATSEDDYRWGTLDEYRAWTSKLPPSTPWMYRSDEYKAPEQATYCFEGPKPSS